MKLLDNLRTWPARHRAVVVAREAAARTHSESDRIAYALDVRLLTHPNAPVATDADYPAWRAQLDAQIAKNRQRRTT